MNEAHVKAQLGYFKLLAEKKLADKERGSIGVEVTATELECLKETIDMLMKLYTDLDQIIQERKANRMKDSELDAALDNLYDDLGSPVLGSFERLSDVLFLRDTQ